MPDAGSRSDAGVDAGTPDAGPSLDVISALLAARRCEYLVRCGLIGPTASEAASCLAVYLDTWCGPTTWPSHVTVGALKLDLKLAQSCADAFATADCADYATLPVACTQLLKPNAGLHQACYDGYPECSDGVCRGATCPRTCQPPGELGEVCNASDDCRTGLYCRLSTTTPGVGVCSAYSQVGDACDQATLCLDGLWCVTSMCRLIPTRGQPCLLGRCDDLSYCDQGTDGGLCVQRKGTGEKCLSGQCLSGFTCSALSAACIPQSVAAAGDGCTTEQLCPTGTTCVGAVGLDAGRCVPPLEAAAPCLRSEECSAELACGSAGDGGLRCQPRAGDGGVCGSARDCLLDATCVQGRCAPTPDLGERCTVAQPCRRGTCVAGASPDGGAQCRPLLAVGSPCQTNADCASQQCNAGKCLGACTP